MHTAHMIQLVLIVVGLVILIAGIRLSISANRIGGDNGVGDAMLALLVIAAGGLPVLIAVLWFLIGGILGF